MSTINQWLREHPRTSARWAPMGHTDEICNDVLAEMLDGKSHPIYIERLVVVDGDYDLSGTYWGFGDKSEPMWCGYTLGEDGSHDNGIRIFVRANRFHEAMDQIEHDLHNALGGNEFKFDFKRPGEDAIYGETLASIGDMVQSYLDTARFTDMGPDSNIPDTLPFSKRAQFDAALDILNFIDDVRSDENAREGIHRTLTWSGLMKSLGEGEYTLTQLAGDLWYDRNGHGVGAWTRGLSTLGDRLSKIARDMGSRSVYTNDNKVAEIE